MAENPQPAPQNVQMAMQCQVQQMGNQMIVVVGFQCGTLSAGMMMPPQAVRAMARQLIEAADKADETLLKPPSMLAPN